MSNGYAFPWVNELNHTMPELVLWAAETYGDDIFLVNETGETTTFREFAVLAAQAARAFLAAGITFGDPELL
jgi:hypothetical protein